MAPCTALAWGPRPTVRWLRVQAAPGGTNPTASASPAWGELLKQEEPQDFWCALGWSRGWWGVLWMRLCKAQQSGARDAQNMSECLQTPSQHPEPSQPPHCFAFAPGSPWVLAPRG